MNCEFRFRARARAPNSAHPPSPRNMPVLRTLTILPACFVLQPCRSYGPIEPRSSLPAPALRLHLCLNLNLNLTLSLAPRPFRHYSRSLVLSGVEAFAFIRGSGSHPILDGILGQGVSVLTI